MITVLIIEDDTILRENTAELLELSNYKVITAPNGKIGFEMAKKELPDIIVCDIMMPEIDGYETLDRLSKDQATMYIPFIFLSAKTEQRDIRKGMNMGADDYITKPFNEQDLISAIESRLAKTAILKESRVIEQKLSREEDIVELKSLNDLKNFFDDNGTSITVEKDVIIYREGDHSNFVYLIRKGTVKSHIIDEQGKELITALYKEDDLFGFASFTDNKPYKETATAIESIEMVGISSTQFNQILSDNHDLAMELMQLLSNDLLVMKNQLLEMAYGSVNRKTAATILKFAEKINRNPNDPIRISRSDLASVAGIATETLIRALTGLKKQGLIKIDGRNIKVLDIEKLKQIA